MIIIDWYRCKGNVWCQLNRVDQHHKNLEGVEGIYIVWYGFIEDKNIVKIGSGNITNKITELQKDIAIQAFNNFGLFITWAEAPKGKFNSIVAFLNQTLKPKIPEASPKVLTVAKVNYPWDQIDDYAEEAED